MSNYLSRPYQVDSPVSQMGDLNLAINVANTLQTRYDQGKALVDQTLAQYESLKTLRPEDNEYIATKINQARNMLNGNIRYEHQSQVLGITNGFRNILKDPIVADAIYSKGVMNQYDTQALKAKEKIKGKSDGSYSDLNYQYGKYKGGYDDYMAGKTNRLGAMSYENYTDYRKELKGIADNIEKYDTEIERTSVKGGYIYTQKGKVITEDKIKILAESFLSDGAKKQMTISGWGNIHQGRTEEERQLNTKQAFQDYSIAKLKDEKSKLELSQALATKSGLDTDKNSAKIAQDNYTNIEKRLKDISTDGSYEQMYGTIYRDTTLTNFAKTMAYNTVDISDIKGDTTQMAREKMAYEAQRYAIKDSQWKAGYNLELKKAGLKLDVNGNPVGDGNAFDKKADPNAQPENAEDVEKTASEELTGLNTTIDTQTQVVYDSLNQKTQEQVDVIVNNSKGLKTRTDVLVEFQKGGSVGTQEAITLSNLVNSRYVKQREYNKHSEIVDKEAEVLLDSDAVYKDLYNNPNIKIMWHGNDGKERLYPAKEVLVNNGLVNEKGEKIKSNKQVIEAIKKSMLADKFMSEGFNNQLMSLNPYLINLAKLNGEKIDDVIIKSNEKGHSGKGYQRNEIDYTTKTGKIILAHEKRKAYDASWSTDSFDDINSVDQYFKKVDPEQRRLEIGKKIAQDKTSTFGEITTVMPGTTEYQQIARQAGFKIDDKTPIEIRHIPSQPNMVNVSLGAGSWTENKPNKSLNQVQLRIEDLGTSVLSQVDFYNSKSVLNVENFPQIHQSTTYTQKSGGALASVANNFFNGDLSKAKLTTQTGAKSFFFNNFEEVLGKESAPTKLGKAVTNLINDENTHIEIDKYEEGNVIYKVPAIYKGDKPLYVFDYDNNNMINNNNADSMYQTMKFIPQDYTNKYLMQVLQSQDETQINKVLELYGN